MFPNLISYVFCIFKAGIWLLSKKHYFHCLLISNICYWIDIFCFSIINGFLVNFDITYSLKLVFAWVNISRILRTRLLQHLVDVIKNILWSISLFASLSFLTGCFCIFVYYKHKNMCITFDKISNVLYLQLFSIKTTLWLLLFLVFLAKTVVALFLNKMILEDIENLLARYLSVK